MNKKLTIGIVVVLVLAIFVSAKVFESDAEALAYKTDLASKVKVPEVKIIDISSHLNDANYVVVWQLYVYDDKGAVLYTKINSDLFPKTESNANIENELKKLGQAQVDTYDPNPEIRYKTSSLYGKVIQLEAK